MSDLAYRRLHPAWQELGATVHRTLDELARNWSGFGSMADLAPHLRILIPPNWPPADASLPYPDSDPVAATLFLVPVERSPHVSMPVLGLPLIP